MILLDTSAADAVHVMERARSEIERHTHEEMPHCRLTASFGIAGLRESDLIFDTLIRRADRALYRSKLAGRNCISIAKGDSEVYPEWRLVERAQLAAVQLWAFLPQQFAGFDAHAQMAGDRFLIKAIGLTRQLQFTMDRLVRHA